ncbi:Scopoletin glucosyltransferase [Vitis vinifera]|uniref:Scopoletin glucosyltransferase n=1 Tax=Vitis vinifera TaxID=29760 RepID=A0A438EPU4_VITVI|nr:Scopoletin glucosyltransferase [Vitis vinifera]
MGNETDQLHVLFFPFMALGHMIPTIDMAKLFSARGVRATIITTPLNAPVAGLPQGLENLDQDASPEIRLKFFLAMSLFQQPLEQLLQEYRPHGLVADAFFPWALDVASKFGIPRLAFQGTGFFAMCALQSLTAHKPYKGVGSDTEPFLLPDLPDEIKLTRLQISNDLTLGLENDFTRFFKEARESEERSYGTIVNTFYELEPAYAEHWRKVLGRKAWHIGPVSLCNRDAQDKTQRGKAASIDEDECLKWLNSKNPDSVIYNKDEGDEEEWLPQGSGGFVTHCGWNSTLEGVSAGVPMVTWPVFADQFYNEKLLTDVLKIGIGVGAQRWVPFVGDFVKQDAIEKAVKAVMAGEKAEELRSRAKSLGGMARRAIEKEDHHILTWML